MATSEATIKSLNSLLEESVKLAAKDPKTLEKLQQAQKLVKSIETTETGILSKFRLHGQVALVTGGGQGIGRGFAHGLGEAGAKVAVADLELSRAETVAAELKAKGVDSLAIQVDVSKKEECEAMVAKVVSTWGNLHIAFNNAGIVFHSNSEETSQKEWQRTMSVNLDGVFFCCQAEAKHMLSKGYGRIINTASMSGTIVNHPQKQVAYNVSKAGVVHMTKTLGSEWAQRGVRVNCISPGYIETPLNATKELEALKRKWCEDTPMGRLGLIEDLVGLAIYLASPLSDFMTGSDCIIDGGFTCW